LNPSDENFQNVFILANTFLISMEILAPPANFMDFPISLPDFFLVGFGRHGFPQTFQIVGNLPGSVATPLPRYQGFKASGLIPQEVMELSGDKVHTQ
jgi:hypothetical protein